ncbi:hypothetical protein N7462_008988 [Penicillium macrosclerotiorum]|uniref:uncharacterized protein n=1 Tax=Penicillium macrosclerotiorum TaxID=303699 RepID=UPI002549763A|nr:uncharacterized protein N7462_008988 [Penicillium macrosclerotiorum]KAJ5676091.1 hypothetical protein N7462_008988 [Penicillium macrosclerotiorum]
MHSSTLGGARLPHAQLPHAQLPGPAMMTGPRGGRGKKLTPQEDAILREICHARKGSANYSSFTKAFWRQVSSEFHARTGRSYSWQSCRRRMLSWEASNQTLESPAPSSPVPPSSLGGFYQNIPEGSSASNRDVLQKHGGVTSMNESDGEDDDLPPAPIYRSAIHYSTNHELQVDMLRGDVVAMVNNGVVAMESQMRCFATAIADDPDDLDSIVKTFDCFKLTMKSVLEKYKHALDEDSAQ